MDQGPLVIEEANAGEEFVRRLDKRLPVSAAFWVKDSEEERWYLYVASDEITDSNLNVAYGEVLRVAADAPSPHLDPFQVKLIPSGDPLAQAALTIHHRFPTKLATRLGSSNFGGMGVDAVYLYPAPNTTLAP